MLIYPIIIIPQENIPGDWHHVQTALFGVLNENKKGNLRIIIGRIAHEKSVRLRVIGHLRRTGLSRNIDGQIMQKIGSTVTFRNAVVHSLLDFLQGRSDLA